MLILVASGTNTKGSAVDCARFGDDTASLFRGASFGLEPALDVQCLRAQGLSQGIPRDTRNLMLSATPSEAVDQTVVDFVHDQPDAEIAAGRDEGGQIIWSNHRPIGIVRARDDQAF